MFEVVKAIEKAQSTRRDVFAKCAGLYLDVKTRSADASSLLSRLTPTSAGTKRTGTNVVQSCVDTAGAHISKNRPRPLFLTSGGDLALQLQGRQLTRYVDGLFAMIKIHETGQKIARDSRIFGTGIGYFYADPADESIKVERVMVDELRVDDDEARNGMPRQLHRVRTMSRDELIDLFPEHADAIVDAPNARDTKDYADLVEVIESWHLPTGKVRYEGDGEDKKPITDGSMKTTLGGKLELQSLPYTKDYFPFLPLYWTDPLAGFWGRGLAEELTGKQREINNYDADIQEAMKLSAKIKWLVPEGSAIDPDGISDVVAEQIKYSGPTPPTPIIPPAVSPELIQHRKTLISESYELTGVSQSQATATKEPGLDSGVAVREQNDINSTRFVLKAQAFEAWFIEAARICIDLARDLYDTHKVDIKVKGRAGKFIESIPWSKVNLDNDAYDMQVFPVSLLPTTPQGRMQTLTEMVEMGGISVDEMRRLMDFPDLEDFNSLATAQFDYAAGLVADLLEGDQYEAPDNRMDLQMIWNVALANYGRALRMKVPEQILENLRHLMDECELWLSAVADGIDIRKAKQFNEWLEGRNDNAAPPPQMPMDPAMMDPAAMADPAMMDPMAGGAMPPAA